MTTTQYPDGEPTKDRKNETGGSIARIGGVRVAAFYAAVLVGMAVQIVVFGIGLAVPLFGWFDPSLTDSIHFVHDMAFLSLMLVAFVGLTAQLYKPVRRIAGLQQVLVLFALFLAGIAVMGLTVDARLFEEATFVLLVFGSALVAALLHPARRELLRIRATGPVSPVLVGLAVVAAIPLVLYAADQFALQGSGDEHAIISHYAGMVVYAAAIVSFGLLASPKGAGWRVPLYSAVGLALILGVASMLRPDVASSVGTTWGVAAILWAIAFAAAGELTARRGEDASRVTGEPGARTE